MTRKSLRLLAAVALSAPLAFAVPIVAATPAAAIGPTTSRTAAPPTMGWSTWNHFADTYDFTTIKAQADAMVAAGMRDAGYVNIGLDEGWWQGNRDGAGNIVVDAQQWPQGMAAVADYLHARGLKAGIYTDAGLQGCGSLYPRNKPKFPNQGSYGHYDQDFLQFQRWGFDFVKVDWCGGDQQGLNPKQQYTEVSAAIQRASAITGREMILNICVWGRDDPWTWGPGIGDSWRTSGDIGPGASDSPDVAPISLDQVIENFDRAVHPLAVHTGYSNDADMMMLGVRGLSDEDNRTHLALWAMLGGPLRAGNNLATMSAQTRQTLTNRDVIAVNQDAAGLGPVRVYDNGAGLQVYSKVLAGTGKRAVLLFNRGTTGAPIVARFSDLGLVPSGTATVRNLWTGQTQTGVQQSFSAFVPARTQAMFVASGVEPSTATTGGEAAGNQLTGTAGRIACPACEGGSRVGYLGNSDGHNGTLTVTGLTAPRTGYAQAQLRYTNGGAVSRTLTMTVNGIDATVVAFPPTGGWDVPNTVSVTVLLREGAGNQLSFANTTGGGADIDAVVVGAPVALNAAALTGGPVTGPGGLCVDVAGANRANGTAMQLYTCNGNGAQQWTPQSDGALEALGKCLDVPGGQTGNGTQVWLWDCTGAANQQWRPGPNGSLVNPSSGRCLDSPGGSTTVGARLQIWDCVGNSAQRFTLPARVARQITGVANRCVDIQGVSAGDAANGNAVGLWDCNGLPWQQWTVRGDGEIQTSAGSGRCLETPGSATAPGTAVQVWDCAGSPWTNQKWWVRTDGSIVNLRSNLCLDTQNGATGNGTRLVINPCDGRASQRWRP
ncbi:ricin-type beta-trefoil lectin domain protein [Dactylosporangium siamense]|uniref:Alpha-galactosidase n=1 Tax=Dactylosporangium siamense TaxID=685454 RepID=A0A919Q1L0_9ACTN|nr:ricin-type beta-trefoil lectin domain protein [Dactylosporangium siamense]GIG52205.1 alpha-galactosidase [Dactylosporangium siamense]